MEHPQAKIEIRFVSPQQAQRWLDAAAPNRKIRTSRVASYARDMEANKWHFTHQGIAFNKNGHLVDGQHRLEAIVKSRKGIWLIVVTGLDPDACMSLDSGLPRSARDSFLLAGKGNYTDALIATARVFTLLPGPLGGRFAMTNDEIVDLIDEHSEALSFSCEQTKGINRISRSTRCLVARAFYHADRERLSEFCHVLRTGQPINPTDAGGDSSALLFARFLDRTKGTSNSEEQERYCKGQNALKSFLTYTPIEKLHSTQIDHFPIIG